MSNIRVEGSGVRVMGIVDAYSDIFDRLDRELWLVTARAGERSSGLIATYASRVSLVPELPRVTIALAKHHFTHELIEATGAFCMHLMDEDRTRLGVAFWNSVRPRGRQTSRAGNFDRRQRRTDFDGRARLAGLPR